MDTGFSGKKPESKMETGVSGMYSNWNYVNKVPYLNCLIKEIYGIRGFTNLVIT